MSKSCSLTEHSAVEFSTWLLRRWWLIFYNGIALTLLGYFYKHTHSKTLTFLYYILYKDLSGGHYTNYYGDVSVRRHLFSIYKGDPSISICNSKRQTQVKKKTHDSLQYGGLCRFSVPWQVTNCVSINLLNGIFGILKKCNGISKNSQILQKHLCIRWIFRWCNKVYLAKLKWKLFCI